MEWLLMVLVFSGTIPMLVSCGQFLLVGLHGLRSPYAHCRQFAPRVAFIVPAWNEGASIQATIQCLMQRRCQFHRLCRWTSRSLIRYLFPLETR